MALSLRLRRASPRNPRLFWLGQLRRWHWISGALSMGGLLLFAVTGFTLNHAAQIEARPVVTTREAVLPPALLDGLAEGAPLPAGLAAAIESSVGIDVAGQAADWTADEIYIALPRPGGDAWLAIDRASGAVRYERTDRGWLSFLNDLHKGRNAGPVWAAFIDLFAAASAVFALTGLGLLALYAGGRRATWPLVGAGGALPVLLALYFIH